MLNPNNPSLNPGGPSQKPDPPDALSSVVSMQELDSVPAG